MKHRCRPKSHLYNSYISWHKGATLLRYASVLLSCLLCSRRGISAETGDFDGDGRLSIRDLSVLANGVDLADGSLRAFTDFPCYVDPSTGNTYSHDFLIPLSVYFEVLRRSVTAPLPHYSPMHNGYLTTPALQPPLPQDGHAELNIDSPIVGSGGLDDKVTIRITLDTAKEVQSFSLILDTGGLIRAPWYAYEETQDGWAPHDWLRINSIGLRGRQPGINLGFSVSPLTYFITGGKLVITYGIGNRRNSPLPSNLYELLIEGRIANGSLAGVTRIQVSRHSEVLFVDGTLASFVGTPAEADLSIIEDVAVGWDEGLPPLDMDQSTRSIIGQIEFRLTDQNGNPNEPGGPVSEAAPGETVTLLVQMRTEVPLNHIVYRLAWPTGALRCKDPPVSLFRNPESSDPYKSLGIHGLTCSDTFVGYHFGRYVLGGYTGNKDPAWDLSTYVDRPLEFFKPLNEWTNVAELRLEVPETARGGTDIPLHFTSPGVDGSTDHQNEFIPFAAAFPDSFSMNCSGIEQLQSWTYDVRYHNTELRVLGDSEPPPPPDLGIEFQLMDASGSSGDIVEIPVFASAMEKLGILRVVASTDPEHLIIEEVNTEVLSLRSGEHVRQVVPRGTREVFRECGDLIPPDEPNEECTWGIPYATTFYATDNSAAYVDWLGDIIEGSDYPGESLQEIARLRVRIASNAPGQFAIEPGRIMYDGEGIEEQVESGGYILPSLDPTLPFSPARKAKGAVVTVVSRAFLRADTNLDSRVDLSDAVATLSYLFLGESALGCIDAADADDSGIIEITDPILVLHALFLGTQHIAPPYPDCNVDLSPDSLSCSAGCSP